jgi:hypothetical protein
MNNICIISFSEFLQQLRRRSRVDVLIARQDRHVTLEIFTSICTSLLDLHDSQWLEFHRHHNPYIVLSQYFNSPNLVSVCATGSSLALFVHDICIEVSIEGFLLCSAHGGESLIVP